MSDPVPDGLLGGRYRLLALLGTGNVGSVFRAEDSRSGTSVAVKVLLACTPRAMARFEREIRALRALALPGVVRLLDEGRHGPQPYLVTELVDGAPFPGPRFDGTWASLAPTVFRLLDILARVHEAGVVHRDLKPANVLVDPTGSPTVLDFGLARLDAVAALTRSGDRLGTPRYQAPEQVRGDRDVDARADLYALGAMIYEALAGRPPQPERSSGRVYAARLLRDAPPLADVAPAVPQGVARAVDRMLARSPDDRPASAAALAEELRGAAPARDAGALPWLGPRAAIAEVRAALRAGEPVAVVGLAGSGRSRVLAEVAGELAAVGAPCAWVPFGERPYESLRALEPDVGGPDDLRERVAARLRAGVLLVDDAERVDAWSRDLLEGLGGPVAWARDAPAPGARTVRLGVLDPDALVPLFHAFDARWEADAARCLHVRTEGLPARIAAEVGRWVAWGLARWCGAKVQIAPHSLQFVALGPVDPKAGRREPLPSLADMAEAAAGWILLAGSDATVERITAASGCAAWAVEAGVRTLEEAGLTTRGPGGRLSVRPDLAALGRWSDVAEREALRALAVTPDDTPVSVERRLQRARAAEDAGATIRAALELARAASSEDRATTAFAAAMLGLLAAVEAAAPESAALAPLAAEAALALDAPRALAAAVRLLGQWRAASGEPGPRGEVVELLVAAHARSVGLPPVPLGEVPPDLEPRLAEAWRDLRFDALLDQSPAKAEPLLADSPPDGWRALAREARLRRRTGRHTDAAALIERALARSGSGDAAAAADTSVSRGPLSASDALSLTLALADARLDAGQPGEAARLATDARAGAGALGLARHALHAATLLRAARGRLGPADPPDPDLLACAEAFGCGPLTARLHLAEAGAAWRGAGVGEAARLARRVVATEGAPPELVVLARALELACDAGALPDACSRVADDASKLGDPAVALQALGLVALARPEVVASRAAVAERLAERAGSLGEPREILSGQEALAFCHAAARRAGRR